MVSINEQHGERALWPALRRGWRGKCPNCGEGRVLHSYLKMRESCSNCNQDFSAARADDGPAYLTILIVGHIATIFMLFTLFASIAVFLSLYLLPRFKGAIVGYQWAKRMFGFAHQDAT
jgi:uncharacterized protein (DUF983 family)